MCWKALSAKFVKPFLDSTLVWVTALRLFSFSVSMRFELTSDQGDVHLLLDAECAPENNHNVALH